ncbi:MAG: pyridoxal 5'-phosphate synthase glutaminase subunit PdxT [Acidobacteriota bacterium]
MMDTDSDRLGVLALQGDFQAHEETLRRLGIACREVREPAALRDLQGLIIPGGESTTLLKLMEKRSFQGALAAFHKEGGALFGTCAGLILLAKRVTSPPQTSLGLLDVDVERNAYGRQAESFEAAADWAAEPLAGGDGADPLPLIFIRAPRITRSGPDVVPLVRCRGDLVLVRQGRILAASFHPELSTDTKVHRLFLDLIRARP